MDGYTITGRREDDNQTLHTQIMLGLKEALIMLFSVTISLFVMKSMD